MSWPLGESEPRPRVLVVCTANICRSPVAAQLVRDGAAPRGLEVSVASAGFLESGRPPDPVMVALAAERGIAVPDHESRVVDADLLRSSDLVVTMERRHARDLIVIAPDVSHRIHTLKGIISAAGHGPSQEEDPAGELDSWLRALADRRRPADLMGERGPDVISDPHGRSRRHYRACLDELERSCAGLLDVIGGSIPPSR